MPEYTRADALAAYQTYKLTEGIQDYAAYLWHKVLYLSEIKTVFAVVWGFVTFLFDPNETNALTAMFLLIVADFAFGLGAASYTGMPVNSSKLRRTAIKFAVYFALAAAGRLTEYALPEALGFLDETIIGYLCATELVSILENSAVMGFSVPGKVLKGLQDYLRQK